MKIHLRVTWNRTEKMMSRITPTGGAEIVCSQSFDGSLMPDVRYDLRAR